LSFSGGGGSTGVSAHKHTNAAGEGGSLDATTLMNNGSLFAQIVGLS